MQRVYKARGGRARGRHSRRTCTVTLPRGQARRASSCRSSWRRKLFAPLSTSDQVGVVRALVDGKVVAEAPMQPLADVPRGNIFRRIWDTILSWFA